MKTLLLAGTKQTNPFCTIKHGLPHFSTTAFVLFHITNHSITLVQHKPRGNKNRTCHDEMWGSKVFRTHTDRYSPTRLRPPMCTYCSESGGFSFTTCTPNPKFRCRGDSSPVKLVRPSIALCIIMLVSHCIHRTSTATVGTTPVAPHAQPQYSVLFIEIHAVLTS